MLYYIRMFIFRVLIVGKLRQDLFKAITGPVSELLNIMKYEELDIEHEIEQLDHEIWKRIKSTLLLKED